MAGSLRPMSDVTRKCRYGGYPVHSIPISGVPRLMVSIAAIPVATG
jgi:hypothetical protein